MHFVALTESALVIASLLGDLVSQWLVMNGLPSKIAVTCHLFKGGNGSGFVSYCLITFPWATLRVMKSTVVKRLNKPLCNRPL